MSESDSSRLEEVFKAVMSSLGLKVKKIRLRLHISKGIDALEWEVTRPELIFLPGGTYILMLEEIEWPQANSVVRFEFIHVTFDVKDYKIRVLSTKTGLQDIEVGITREVAESRELKISQLAERAVQTVIDLLVLSKDVKERIERFLHLTRKK